MNCCMICGNLVDVSDRYCSQCGSCLWPSTQVAEYRFITILCTDLSGYSLLSEDSTTRNSGNSWAVS